MSGESSNMPPNHQAEESTDGSKGTPPQKPEAQTNLKTGQDTQQATDGRPGETTTAPPLRCALTGEEISADEAYWAPPLVTVGDLTRAVVTNIRSPGALGQILMGDVQDVPYSPGAREELARRRSMEQIKLLGVLLLILAVIAVLIFVLLGAGGPAA